MTSVRCDTLTSPMRLLSPSLVFSAIWGTVPALLAQTTNPQVRYVSTDPTTGAACSVAYITVNRITGVMKGCVGGVWAVIGGGGGGSTPGTGGQILTSNGAGGFGTALTPNMAFGPVVLDAGQLVTLPGGLVLANQTGMDIEEGRSNPFNNPRL